MTWLGWLRKHRRCSYELVAQGESIGECHDKLLAVAERCGNDDSLCRLLTQGGAVLREGKIKPGKEAS